MKTVVKIVTFIIAIYFSPACKAQVSATATASATVLTPIGITKVADMNFGNVAVASGSGGTVVLSVSGSRTTGGTGVTLPATSGTVAAAGFTVSGAAGFTYVITLPSACTLSDGGGHSMTLNSFVSNPTATGTLNSSGAQSLKVSATLSVAAAQAPGSYTNASGVPVTVNYN